MSQTRKALVRRLSYQGLGLIFLLVAVLFIATTVGFYRKSFSSDVPVELHVETAGSQLSKGSDVKIRGMRVGEVREVRHDSGQTTLDLALDPDKTEKVPADASARLLPKTLFGERYVALQTSEASESPIESGDVIRQDRSSTAIELEKVMSDVLPLLQAVQPEKLSSTLDAISTSLEGRGEQLGDTLVQLSDYLEEMNPSLPDLSENISELADVTDVYDQAAPEFLDAMDEMTTTTRTILEKREDLDSLYSVMTNSSADVNSFLEANEENFIEVTTTSQPVLDVMAKYAPQYPCMLEQFADSIPAAEASFGHGTDERNHVVITLTAENRGKYRPGVDEPEYIDERGPRCYPQVPAPGRWPQNPPEGPIEDGSSHPDPPKQPDDELSEPVIGADIPFTDGGGGSTPEGTPLLPNSGAENELISLLQSSATGVEPEDAPSWTSLLLGPLYRGTTVEVE